MLCTHREKEICCKEQETSCDTQGDCCNKKSKNYVNRSCAIKISYYLPELWASERGNNAYRCLPILL